MSNLPDFVRREWFHLCLAPLGASLGQIGGMAAAHDIENMWLRNFVSIGVMLGGLTVFALVGTMLLGSAKDRAETRAWREKFEAGQNEIMAGINDIKAGQDKTNRLLEEILDILRSIKASGDRS